MILILKGDIGYSQNKDILKTIQDGYLVVEDGICQGVYETLPQKYNNCPIEDYTGKLIIPGLVDLHIHAAQFAYRGTGFDLELMDWLDRYAFKEETKFASDEYAEKAYEIFVESLKKSATTRLCTFASRHSKATLILMDKLEKSGLVSFVGKVNMDRNAPDSLREPSPLEAKEDTVFWLDQVKEKGYKNTKPIITPRFIPSCTDELMGYLSEIRTKYDVPVQSHLSENPSEIAFVKELSPNSKFYGDAYDTYGLFGKDHTSGKLYPCLMAHCIYSSDEEIDLMKNQNVFIAHSPASNFNVTSGIAPIKKYLHKNMHVGLATDVAGGEHESMFSAIKDAIKASKMRRRYIDPNAGQLSFDEGFYLATKGGGEFFGKVGSFDVGYEFDVVVLDDSRIPNAYTLDVKERLERSVYLNLDLTGIVAKYVKGKKII